VPVAPLTLIWKQKMAAQKNKEISSKDLVVIKPITENQKVIFDTWKKGQNQFLFGAAGTGKTFVSLYLALQDVMDLKKPYDKVILVRSLIPTREIGFLPGDEEDKSALYQVPYQNMVQFMFKMPNETSFNSLYPKLKAQSSLYFLSTSFLRGLTFDNSIIIVDECQNLNFHELDTIITRIGQDSKIIFCGDFAQSDLQRTNEKNGLHDFLRILEEMKEFNCTEFTIGDIVRSGFVRSYLINKTKMGIGME
jgi:predicted ribonuclease YlaK